MARTKTGTKRRKKRAKLRQETKGFSRHRRRTVKGAKEGLMHAREYQYRDRRRKKRELRRLWISRINGALNSYGIAYSQFIHLMKEKEISLNRKVLSQIAVHDRSTFDQIVEKIIGKQADK